MEFTCIMCPVGCHLTVTKTKNEIIVKGNACPRGEIFGKSEATNPTRMVTSVMPYKNKTVSVKTSNPIPKAKIKEVLFEIKNAPPIKNAKLGQVVVKNVAKTGENVIITGINV
ncbi:MAG: DUF1667 domain-containing protein [Clostridia bacterium]|nr:DUF1667 domain-containing protein [Clostridia bacterium]